MRRLSATAALLAILLATLGAAGAQGLRPLVVDWEQYFRVEAAPATRAGRSMVSGTVWNTAPWGAKKIQLLVEGLDAAGQPVTQRVIWLGVDLASGTHASFETPMPAAPAYRVSVFSFDSGRGGRWS
jgi:hypothetical protein